MHHKKENYLRFMKAINYVIIITNIILCAHHNIIYNEMRNSTCYYCRLYILS